MSRNWPDTHLFQLGQNHIAIVKLLVLGTGLAKGIQRKQSDARKARALTQRHAK
jgi:hypothetical protein